MIITDMSAGLLMADVWSKGPGAAVVETKGGAGVAILPTSVPLAPLLFSFLYHLAQCFQVNDKPLWSLPQSLMYNSELLSLILGMS